MDRKRENRVETLQQIYDALFELRAHLLSREEESREEIARVPDEWRESARNLVHYLALRNRDIRSLQVELSQLGLSSLGRLEAHVLAGIESVLFALSRMADDPLEHALDRPEPLDFKQGDRSLMEHSEALLGPPNSTRLVRIMTTMPAEAADRYDFVLGLLEAGTDVARINSAHDDDETWRKIIGNVRRAERELNRSCRILFDLCGPKLRTGEIETRAAIVRIRPQRNHRGVVTEPARVWVGSSPPPTGGGIAPVMLPVSQEFAEALKPGDTLRFEDIPGRKRSFPVLETGAGGAWVEAAKSAYLEPGLRLDLLRKGKKVTSGSVSSIPRAGEPIRLQEGETLVLTFDGSEGRNARRSADGTVIEAARIPCSIPSVLSDIRVGDPILFDDGKIGGRVESSGKDRVEVRITQTPPGGTHLRSDKGINLPETALSLPALSEEDLQNLDFAVEHADMVGFSFVREAAEVFQLQEVLEERAGEDFGIVLKIENRVAFENLPELLLAGLQRPPVGVMVARGDLGVELGFEHLAEVQEQILWLCEAAHVPVVWATQVLEGLAKKGMPSRAEVTDAAMSGRAECVMLNKGPYIQRAVAFLDRILLCMRDHHHKKTPMLRRLKVSDGRFFGD